MNRDILDHFNVTTGVLQGDFLTLFLFIMFLFIILIDHLQKKAVEDADIEVVTHPCQSRRQPTKGLNDRDFADDIALLESFIDRTQKQLCC